MNKKTQKAFEKACKKLGISSELPKVDMLRPDYQRYVIDGYVLAVLIEDVNDGWVADFGDHNQVKYWPWHYCKPGYVGGSSGGGFSYYDFGYSFAYACVGARLCTNTAAKARKIAEDYPELWESVKLFIK